MHSPFGRDAELAELRQLIENDTAIITLTGTAGVGKTTIARHLLRGVDSGVFVDLSDARSQDDIEAAVAAALGAPQPFGTWSEHVVRVLCEHNEAVMVLDNFEHLVAHGRATVGVWANQTPVRFVVTSRERLRLRNEVAFALRPLPLPEEGASMSTLENAASTQLLLARIRKRDPEYQPNRSAAAALAKIARHLDGLPLALELVAPRLVETSAANVLQQLDRDFSSAMADTLQATIASSWDRLSSREQAGLMQCTAFQGGFNLTAAESIVQIGSGEVLEVLQSLFDKSLIAAAGVGRLYLYPSIKSFASIKLRDALEADGESQSKDKPLLDLRNRHARFFAGLAHTLNEQLQSEQADQAWKGLRIERENLRAACDHSDATLAAKATAALAPLLVAQGASAEDERRLARAVARRSAWQHVLLLHRGRLHLDQARVDEAESDLEQAAARASEAGDAAVQAQALMHRARVTFHRGNAAGARAMLEEQVLPLLDRVEDARIEARVRATLGTFAGALGNQTEAGIELNRARATLHKHGAIRGEALVLALLGFWHSSAGRTSEALIVLARAEAILERIGAEVDSLYAAWARSMTLLARREYGAAHSALEAGMRRARKLGARRYAAAFTGYLALCEALALPAEADAAANALARAGALAREARDLGEENHDARTVVLFGALAGGCAARCGEAETAEELLSNAAAKADETGDALLQLAVSLQRAHVAPQEREAALAIAHQPGVSGDIPIEISLDLKLFARTHTDLDAMVPRGEALDATNVLCVDLEQGAFMSPGAAEWVRIGNRTALAAILKALVENHQRGPDTAIHRDELAAAGWPGEIVAPKAMTNRVHVAIATLRKLGLQRVILSSRGTYRLQPKLEVRLVAADV